MSETAVSVRHLFRFFGKLRAVDDISFDLQRGQVLGFIGANGAGKTTAMRMIATLDEPDKGEIFVCGDNVQQFPQKVRSRIGWMPDSYGRYEHTTVLEYLDFYARALGFRGKERTSRINEVLEFTDLGPIAGRDIVGLSKGMAQRLCLGRMLINDPSVLIMDEPAAGLDPRARVEFKHLVRLLAKEKKSVFISSHILSELEDMCDAVLFIDKGRIVHHGSTEVLKRGHLSGAVLEINVLNETEKLQQWLSLYPEVEVLESTRQGCRVLCQSEDREFFSTMLKRMLSDGLEIVEFFQRERKLEDAFIDILNTVEDPKE